MRLPNLIPYKTKRILTAEFGGINRCGGAGENEFCDALGMCSSSFPALASAHPDMCIGSIAAGDGESLGFFENKGICHIRSGVDERSRIYTLYRKGVKLTTFELDADVKRCNIINFNSKSYIFKNNLAYEYDPEYISPIASVSRLGRDLTLTAAHSVPGVNDRPMCISLIYEDMTEIGSYSYGSADSAFPEDAAVGDCYRRGAEFFRLIYKDSGDDRSKDEWQNIVSIRLKLALGDGYRYFYKAGDMIALGDIKYWNWAVRELKDLSRTLRIQEMGENRELICEAMPVFDDMRYILEKRQYPANDIEGYNHPVIDNAGNALWVLEGNIKAMMPRLEFICRGANRLWGCDSQKGEIYSCELGNPRNWGSYEGLASDSYAATVGSKGDFTACCSYMGSPVFFKENEMILISGNKPSSFGLNSFSYRGVAKDSPDGVCVVQDTLYYRAYDGIYAYRGSRPVCVSRKLGEAEVTAMRNVILAAEGDMLHLSARIGDDWVHYVYDTLRDIWHKSRVSAQCGFLCYEDAALALCRTSEGVRIYTLDKGVPQGWEYCFGEAVSGDNSWYWQSADINYNTPMYKYISRIMIEASRGGECDLYISYDSGVFEHVKHFSRSERSLRQFTAEPRRCNSFRIMMKGRGDIVIYSMIKEIEEADNG